jgi:RHH-type proline utilization regulon transcriptional repressor/proline dehydrogenase/delta 1-pyrroline-5-carboxylate dehydrogenase
LSGFTIRLTYDIRSKGQYSKVMQLADLLADLDAAKFEDERQAASAHLAQPPLSPAERDEVRQEAEALVRSARRGAQRQGVVENFLQEFSLSTREGLALMCLAEALLRTPDEATRDRLIAEKIASADWASHLGRSDSLLVNASTWSLMLTGKLIDPDEEARANLPGFIRRLAGRLGEPVIRQAVAAAVRIMGEQFVLGRTIEAAIKRAAADGYVCSFDMLGEGARTETDADKYEAAYAEAITVVGQRSAGQGPEAGHGVSVKLSALSPRYEAREEDKVWAGLYPRILRLAKIAADGNINLTLDAEEADRLALSLKLLARLAAEPELGSWRGLGLAVQAYQKRSPRTVAAVAEIARATGRRLMVRLVKGAYWDSEIKRAQVGGLPGYPVYTTKAATDVSYLACARVLLGAAPALYPQFATHNAHTLAAVRHMARQAGVDPEFQRLHGMGEALYDGASARYGQLKLRVYAPVGGRRGSVALSGPSPAGERRQHLLRPRPAGREDPGGRRGARPDLAGRGGRRRATPAHSAPGRSLWRGAEELRRRGPLGRDQAHAPGRRRRRPAAARRPPHRQRQRDGRGRGRGPVFAV